MLIEDKIYKNDLNKVLSTPLNWQSLNDKTILVIGATGLIGSFLIDVVMHGNRTEKCKIKLVAMGRNFIRLQERFAHYLDSPYFSVISGDVNEPLPENIQCEYIFHGASNTHPLSYVTDPVGTIMTNILGTQNVMNFAKNHSVKRILFLSTVEIYGENRGDTDLFDENYCGYIDCNTLRAGYPEGKRASEALCQAYKEKYDIDVVIPRICRTFGPTMLSDDSKASSQFLKNAILKKDIILKSEGQQFYSFAYVGDIVSALLFLMVHGETGEAYNVGDESGHIHLKDLAEKIATIAGVQVKFEIPDQKEAKGYSKATKALLSYEKISALGWQPIFGLHKGLENTIQVIQSIEKQGA